MPDQRVSLRGLGYIRSRYDEARNRIHARNRRKCKYSILGGSLGITLRSIRVGYTLCWNGFYPPPSIESNKSSCCPALPRAWVPVKAGSRTDGSKLAYTLRAPRRPPAARELENEAGVWRNGCLPFLRSDPCKVNTRGLWRCRVGPHVCNRHERIFQEKNRLCSSRFEDFTRTFEILKTVGSTGWVANTVLSITVSIRDSGLFFGNGQRHWFRIDVGAANVRRINIGTGLWCEEPSLLLRVFIKNLERTSPKTGYFFAAKHDQFRRNAIWSLARPPHRNQ